MSFTAAVVSAGCRWPWKRTRGRAQGGDVWPRLFVAAAEAVLGTLVAAAAHEQISGPWPAFIFGIGGPAAIRGLRSGVEVTNARDSDPHLTVLPQPTLPLQEQPAPGPEEVREDAS
ncbi:hypothetical protein [Streptomyces sp. NPDC059168]|uniref:hypothetical protein n=1 Tax=Streptomyces sp. NPDC059168 TaxID=3346753 RepID=UPI0036789CBC